MRLYTLASLGIFAQLLLGVQGLLSARKDLKGTRKICKFIKGSFRPKPSGENPQEELKMDTVIYRRTGPIEDTVFRPESRGKQLRLEEPEGLGETGEKNEGGSKQAQCIICPNGFSTEDTVVKLAPCHHYFHEGCIMDHLSMDCKTVKVDKPCPFCKKRIGSILYVKSKRGQLEIVHPSQQVN
ncbi:uncharacterized protein PGTG_17233 [Puccinia graminis f. sp. tritici CRL 75-36-700-3]|uniref:RING-type domain-containing protein n=1 Tax=Puccinia graminis f. sp. tritici (strain CRL 75-36-700-3 / race SCCL) TaxID=418459 RepID=E3L336_PUCGT|nr:uncharacterized protein PGTG_17233 [Puccinia graminis f. sp. tritici CRL 75-36-700-3]EFP90961.2 hypothetical protein PGTG_17233 [Puccinia graminis f. sp. tritici CRL 75-36-700-3]